MGKIKDTISLIAIILGGTGVLAAGGGAAYNVINQPKDGVDGKDGNSWKAGIANIEEIELGNEGDFYYDTDDYKLYQVENGAWTLKVENFGKPGEQGAQGEKGEKGETGEQGVQGEQGLKGETGDKGVQGEQGLKGETGEQGAQGIQGIQGEKGDQGAKGDPGTNGTNGTNGSSSYFWVKYSGTMPSKDSDMKDDVSNFMGVYSGTSSSAPSTYSSYTWFEIKGAKGDTGEQGTKGDKGDAGKDGTSVYVGYDGYIWNASERTSYKFGELDDLCTENTLELYTSNYFTIEEVDTISSRIALTGEYYLYINKTIYNETTLGEITVYTTNAGTLEIGTISLVDGTVNASQFTVVEGKNVIDVSAIKVGKNETIVLGGGTTDVKLYKAVGIDCTDTYGNYSIVGTKFEVNNSKTGEVFDKLIVNVTLSITTSASTKLLKNVVTDAGAVSGMTDVSQSYGPYKYQNEYFSGKTITKLGVAVGDSNNGKIILYVVGKTQTSGFKTNNKRTIVVELNCAKDKEINDWVYTDVNIVLASDETLAFDYYSGGEGNGAYWRYKNVKVAAGTTYSFYTNTSTAGEMLTFDIEGYTTNEYVTLNVAQVREALITENESNKTTYLHNQKLNELKTEIAGKKVSILGDSISTYTGWSNDAANTNSTIGSNAIYYTGSNIISSVEQTWWKQFVNDTETVLLVDNAYSGDRVTTGGQSRCEQLHDNTGNEGNVDVNPEIILVYLGINDFDNNVSVANFKTGYENMISKIVAKYTGTDIFLFTLLPNNAKKDDSILTEYNTIIRNMATEYGYTNVHIVDLFADSGINRSNLTTYMGCSQQLHPNAAGMDMMTLCVENTLYDFYCGD